MKKLLILDSNSIINRAFYGIRYLSASDGTPTNAVYGFMNILLKLLNEQKPDYLCAAFDLKSPTFRHKMFNEYKAQRKPMPEGLAAQMPIAKEIIKAMNIPILELEGYEADDIIGTVSKICEENETECFIATGDKDDLQLASSMTKVILTVSRMGTTDTTIYDENAVKEKYEVTPTEFIDVKALMGDPSDNIPGVKGIGEKTAIELIKEYGSIEYIFDNLDSLGFTKAKYNKLNEGREIGALSKTLATIKRDVPINFKFSECEFSGDIANDSKSNLYDILKRLELNSLIKKFELNKTENTDIFKDTETVILHTSDELKNALSKVKNETSILFDFDNDTLTNIAFTIGNTAYCTNSSVHDILDSAKDMLCDENIKKTVCNVKDSIVKLKPYTDLNGIDFDAAIAAYLINPARKDYSLEDLAQSFISLPLSRESKQISLFDEEDDDTLAKFALALKPLRKALDEKIKENNQEKLLYDVEIPLITVLAEMQVNGFLVDSDEIKRFSDKLELKINSLRDEIWMLAGEEFNINSPKQLGVILYEKLELKPVKKTKTGYSTNADALEKLKGKHIIIDLITEYRQYTKLKSTYCDSLSMLINPKTHRLHSIFQQTVTVTGRLSSTEPNMQNIPTRTELGREMRKMFIAKDGYTLVDADYSQIELRILADISNDDTMIQAFKNNEDIHAVTASQVLNIPLNEITKEQRASAKAVNFGIVYGIGEFSLSQDIGVSVKEAKAYIDSYLEKYHGVREYMENMKTLAKDNGYVKTMMNRIRYIPELNSSSYPVRQFGERVAMNSPIQGSAADIIKLAMVRVYNRIKGMKSRLILQVHDELIVEAELSEVDEIKKILKEEMENAVHLRVPLVVDMSEGKSWFDAK